jgi:hypothetical protein
MHDNHAENGINTLQNKLNKAYTFDHNTIYKGITSEKDKRMARITIFILPYLVGQPEDFEKEVQISQSGDCILLSRVDEANHRFKTFQFEGNNIFLNHKHHYSFISFR